MIRKRSGSPLPPSPGDSKKAKSESSSFQVPKWKVGTRSPTVELSRSTKYKPPTRGSEWLRLPPALGRDPLPADINDLVILTTEQLAGEGKRLIRAPRLLSDGISFDWVLDFSTKNEDTKSLMSVEGISSASLRAVLQRGETRSAQRHGTSTIINILSDDDDEESKPTILHVAGERGGNIANPIIIDVDDEDSSHTPNCNSDISTTPVMTRTVILETLSSNNFPADFCRHCKNSCHPRDPKYNNDSPRLASTSRLGSSVQSPLRASKSAGIQDRNPLYGDWDMLAAESSETEADHGRSSTRESSPDYKPAGVEKEFGTIKSENESTVAQCY
ncbi:hypothetical protein A0H81_03584 [Grifola frondosa]|uniref:Uncharacterized protein n=1 Tax=Grifola frondosa TaxID=5627 RepID=A0A1C7MH07_GRIFR|nr:hypothetical protein A0H81_03584 [Grifola frondosa]